MSNRGKQIVLRISKWIVSLGVFIVLVLKFRDISVAKVELSYSYLMLAILLMPLNYGLEALKWYRIVRNYSSIDYRLALKSVFVAVPYGILTPSKIGEWYGKTIFLDGVSIWQRVWLGSIAGVIQQLITIVMGLIGLGRILNNIMLEIVGMGVGILGLLVVFVVWRKQVNSIELLQIFWIGFIRYLIFVIQYVLIFWSLGAQKTMESFFIVMSIYLGVYLLPLNFLGDLSLRALIGEYFFGNLQISALAGSIIWGVNNGLAAIIGVYLLNFDKK